MLRVAEHFEKTDTGRARRANEDSFHARSPLFVVADGMGGAQAGEVASQMAVERFGDGLPDGPGSIEERLAGLIAAANRSIHERSRSDADRAGMGTTTTAAYVAEDGVALAHVGDSRAYRLREATLERLTDDHSLVEEMVRQGKLTPEEAEEHPQRSIITRALGPEPDVEVDTRTAPARHGDVFLLCSDGLTSMVGEGLIGDVLRSAPSLREAGHELVAAANEAGGRDNITVVLFRVEDVGAGARGPVTEQATSSHAAVRDPEEPITEPGPQAGPRQPRARVAAPADGERRRRVPGPLKALLVTLAILAPIAFGFFVATRAVYFVGTDASGRVALFRGLPYELPGGLRLYQRTFVSGVAASAIPERRRENLLDHSLRSHDDASDLVRQLEQGSPALLVTSARNRELVALIPASLLVTAGFAAVFIQRDDVLSNISLTYGALFLGLCLGAHVVLRLTLPHADPYLFPLVALLACFGLVMIYRIDETFAREQAQWFVVGLVLFAATILLTRDLARLERYRYVIAAAGLALLVLPRVPGIGQQVNGAYLGVRLGPISFQPAEFAKIAIVVFLASYLRDTRQLLVLGGRRVLGVVIPPLKHFGPLLAVWGTAMVFLFVIQDIGSSLMFYGGFLAVLYVATDRLSFPLLGLAMFAVGARVLYAVRPTIESRVEAWLNPFDPELYDRVGGSYQIAQSVFAQADGGLFGQGFGQALLNLPGGGTILPAAKTDLIYAVITNELGLAGACGLILIYLLVVERGFKTAMLARDSFSKLLATGLTAVLALQVFVIVGGVTRVIPLTGVTLPFVSYGGSSILANFVLLALLLVVSEKARRPQT